MSWGLPTVGRKDLNLVSQEARRQRPFPFSFPLPIVLEHFLKYPKMSPLLQLSVTQICMAFEPTVPQMNPTTPLVREELGWNEVWKGVLPQPQVLRVHCVLSETTQSHEALGRAALMERGPACPAPLYLLPSPCGPVPMFGPCCGGLAAGGNMLLPCCCWKCPGALLPAP